MGEIIVTTDDQNIDVDDTVDMIDAKKIQKTKKIVYQTT